MTVFNRHLTAIKKTDIFPTGIWHLDISVADIFPAKIWFTDICRTAFGSMNFGQLTFGQPAYG
jgi:hypothetical protein